MWHRTKKVKLWNEMEERMDEEQKKWRWLGTETTQDMLTTTLL